MIKLDTRCSQKPTHDLPNSLARFTTLIRAYQMVFQLTFSTLVSCLIVQYWSCLLEYCMNTWHISPKAVQYRLNIVKHFV